MARQPQTLQRIFATDATLAAWDARRRRDATLAELVRRHLPRPLADRIRIADAQSSELQLEVGAGAVAAILRQQTPDLLAVLRREGWKFSAIAVRVQVRSTLRPEKKPPPRQVDRSFLRPLAGLARDLPPGPLKLALGRLLRRAG